MVVKKTINIMTFFLCLLLLSQGCKSPTDLMPQPNAWIAHNAGLSNPHVQALTIDPHATNILYASGFGGIYRSTDSGASWKLSNQGLSTYDIPILVCHPQTSDLVYAGTWGHGIFISDNGGLNWRPINNGITDLRMRTIVVDSHNPQHLVAASNTEIVQSIDGGNIWSTIPKPPGKIRCLTINFNSHTLFVGTDYNGIYRSYNEGISWEEARTGLPYATEGYFFSILDLRLDPFAQAFLWATISSNGIYRSDDDGNHWLPVNTGLSEFTINCLAVTAQDPKLVLIGTANGVYMTADGAQSWRTMNQGLGNLDVRTLVIDPKEANVFYAGTMGGGVFKYVRK